MNTGSFRYEILYHDGLGNPRRWGITTDYAKAERSLARLRKFMGLPYLGYIKRLPS